MADDGAYDAVADELHEDGGPLLRQVRVALDGFEEASHETHAQSQQVLHHELEAVVQSDSASLSTTFIKHHNLEKWY